MRQPEVGQQRKSMGRRRFDRVYSGGRGVSVCNHSHRLSDKVTVAIPSLSNSTNNYG